MESSAWQLEMAACATFWTNQTLNRWCIEWPHLQTSVHPLFCKTRCNVQYCARNSELQVRFFTFRGSKLALPFHLRLDISTELIRVWSKLQHFMTNSFQLPCWKKRPTAPVLTAFTSNDVTIPTYPQHWSICRSFLGLNAAPIMHAPQYNTIFQIK